MQKVKRHNKYFSGYLLDIQRKNMKNPNRETVSQLEALPNLGKAISSDLRQIGISKPQDLVGKDPFDLYNDLCIKKVSMSITAL